MMKEWERLNVTCQLMSKALSHMNTAKVEMEGISVFMCVLTPQGHIKPTTQRLLLHQLYLCGKISRACTQNYFLLITSLFYFSLKLSQTTNKVV